MAFVSIINRRVVLQQPQQQVQCLDYSADEELFLAIFAYRQAQPCFQSHDPPLIKNGERGRGSGPDKRSGMQRNEIN